MTYIPPSSPLYEPPSRIITHPPYKVGEKVRPHYNFKNYYPDITECTIKSCEKGFCESGWLVVVEEFNNPKFGSNVYDSGWFFKL